MVCQKTSSHKLLACVLAAALLFFCSPVGVRAATGGAVSVSDKRYTINDRLFIPSVSYSRPASDGLKTVFPATSIIGTLIIIPDTSIDVTYTIRVKISKLEYVLKNSYDFVKDASFVSGLLSYSIGTDIDHPSISGTYNAWYLIDGVSTDELVFDVEGQEGQTRVYYAFQFTLGTVTYNRPALASGESTSILLGNIYPTFTNLSYEAQVGSKDVVDVIEEQTKVIEEQVEVSKGIFGAISDFFGSFFDNLIDAIVGLVIPSSEDILALLDEINQWFGERLGFLYYPFGLVYTLVAALANGDSDTSLTVPSFTLNILGTEYVIWQSMPVDIDAFDIMKYVRLFTSFLMVSGVVRMAISKWDEWIGGHDG